MVVIYGEVRRAVRSTAAMALVALLLVASLGVTAVAPAYASAAKVKVYTFEEVGETAKSQGTEIIKQKQSLDQAEYNKTSSLTNYQNQVYNFSVNPELNISESTLYSLQESYESAITAFEDAQEAMEKLRPKVAYGAQKLYIEILQTRAQIQIQELEIKRLADEYELAKVKSAFGIVTQAQLRSAKAACDSAGDTMDSLTKSLDTARDSMREYLGLAQDVDFALEDPPQLGEYQKEFIQDTVIKEALKNSLSLSQAQREMDDMETQRIRYLDQGEYSQAERLKVSAPAKELAMSETRKSLTTTVKNLIADLAEQQKSIEKAVDSLDVAQAALLSTQTKLKVAKATLSELRQAEKAVATAERELLQARYNYYFATQKVRLAGEGILVS